MKSILFLLAFALAAHAETIDPVKTKSKSATRPAKAAAASSAKAKAPTYKTIVGQVDGIVCAFCVQGIQKRFEAHGKADQVFISLAQKTVTVSEKPGQTLTDEEFNKTIKEAGFEAKGITRSPLTIAEAKSKANKERGQVAQIAKMKAATVAAH